MVWHTLVITAQWRLRWKDYEFESSLAYKVRPYLK